MTDPSRENDISEMLVGNYYRGDKFERSNESVVALFFSLSPLVFFSDSTGLVSPRHLHHVFSLSPSPTAFHCSPL